MRNIFLLRLRDQIYRHEGISLNTAYQCEKVLRIKSRKLHTVDINGAVKYLICCVSVYYYIHYLIYIDEYSALLCSN